MNIIQCQQGSSEWFQHRAKSFNASDAAAMLGIGPYKTRGQLLHEMATGIIPEVDEATQRRFDDGHRFEELARPLAEKIIGQDLFPVVGSEGRLSASFDGLTMDWTTCWEHKTLSKAIPDPLTPETIPEGYRAQMEQQLMISGAERCLFHATRFDDAGECTGEAYCWYQSDQVMRERLLQGWAQFESDLASYTPPEYIPAAIATPTLDLPAVVIEATGSLSVRSNLLAFGERLNAFIKALPAKPATDQEFADCKAALTKLKTAEETLDSEEARALAQLSEIEQMRQEKKLYFDLSRTTRLALEKLVEAREKAIKVEAMQSGKDHLAEHIAALNKRLGKPYMPEITADWATAIKNKRTPSSLHEAVNNLLVAKKIESSAIADKIQINLESLRSMAKDHTFLFADTQQIVLKPNDDLVTLIKMRISDHEKAEAARIEKIKEDARIAAEAKARADQEEAERQRIAEEARLRAEQEQRAKTEEVTHAEGERAPTPQFTSASSPPYQSIETINAKRKDAGLQPITHRPTDDQIIACLAFQFKASESQAIEWLATFDADGAIERLAEREVA